MPRQNNTQGYYFNQFTIWMLILIIAWLLAHKFELFTFNSH